MCIAQYIKMLNICNSALGLFAGGCLQTLAAQKGFGSGNTAEPAAGCSSLGRQMLVSALSVCDFGHDVQIAAAMRQAVDNDAAVKLNG